MSKVINNTTKNITNNNTEFKTTVAEDLEITKELASLAGSTKEEISRNYEEIMQTKKEAFEDLLQNKKEAAETAFKIYSNQKGIDANKMYEEYMNGAIGQNFSTATELNQAKIKFDKWVASEEIRLLKKEAEVDAENARKKALVEAENTKQQLETQAKIEVLTKELKELKANKKALWVNRIFWPILGIVLGVIAFGLLYFLY